MATVDLRISRAWEDTDDRGRPIMRYALADAEGEEIGDFTTPIGSNLSQVLKEEIIGPKTGQRIRVLDTEQYLEFNGENWVEK